MKHLTISDMYALKYHYEAKIDGDEIMSPEYEREVTEHLDNCNFCKNRYIVKNDEVIDILDEIVFKIKNIYQKVVQNLLQENISNKEEYIEKLNTKIYEYFPEINTQINKLKDMGLSDDEIINLDLDKKIINSFEMLQ